jgi:hypothetical protein
MLDTLQQEGYQIKENELAKIRRKNGWHLRDNSRVPKKPKVQKTKPKKKKARTGGVVEQIGAAILDSSSSESESESDVDAEGDRDFEVTTPAVPPESPPDEPADPELLRRNQERLMLLQAESDARWKTRKRRRRTRGWGPLPADDPNEPPRFPSETTLDESKSYLHLDKKLYRQVREQFEVICREMDVNRKTSAGPEKWALVKNRIVMENAHLTEVFRNDPEALLANSQNPTPDNKKALALDVICMDVTKRMRTIGQKLLLPEVKNTLGFNPAETREARNGFYEVLKKYYVTTKTEAGVETWNDMMREWMETDIVARAVALGPADPEYGKKLKSLEALARDVLKRYRSDNNKKYPGGRQQISIAAADLSASNIQQSSQGQQPLHGSSSVQHAVEDDDTPELGVQIDPSLLLAANDPSVMPPHSHQRQHGQQQQHQHQQQEAQQYQLRQHQQQRHRQQSQQQSTSYVMPQTFYNTAPAPVPIYFRLHPHSAATMRGKHLWLSILQTGTFSELRSLAMREHPGMAVIKVEGLVVHRIPGQPDREILFTIDDDDELAGYLEHVAGGKATFVVILADSGGPGQGFV